MKVDLHNHLGKNGANPGFDKTIDLVYHLRGPNFMFGITNCNCDIDDNRFETFTEQTGKYERVWLDDERRILFVPEKNIYVVGTEEILTKQGHLLVLGTPSYKNVQNGTRILSLEDALKSANEISGIKIVAHPFGRDGLGNHIDEHLFFVPNIDGWEVYNASAELAVPGFLPFRANEKSLDFYNTFSKYNSFKVGACAFTDGHSVDVIGRSYTVLNLETVSVNNLRTAIKDNKSLENLHMEPAKWDAFKHAVNMTKHHLFNCGA